MDISTDQPGSDPRSIDGLNLTVRSYNCLKDAGIVTIGQLQLVDRKSLLRIKQLGVRSAKDIAEALDELGVEHKLSA